MQTTRLLYLDAARGWALMMVVVGHLIHVPDPQSNWLIIKNILFAVHLPLFLVITGMLTKQRPIGIVVQKQANTLIKPYLMTAMLLVLLSIIWQAILPIHTPRFGEWESIAYAIFMANGSPQTVPYAPYQIDVSIGAIWYFVGLFWALVGFQGVIRLKRAWQRWSVVLLSAWLSFTIATFWTLPWSINAAMIMLVFLLVGYEMRDKLLMQRGVMGWVIASLGIWFYSGSLGQFSLVSGTSQQPWVLALLGGVAGALFWLWVFYQWEAKRIWGLMLLAGMDNAPFLSWRHIC
jgi:fucose 4-O-acetylase-like acetyltransferase